MSDPQDDKTVLADPVRPQETLRDRIAQTVHRTYCIYGNCSTTFPRDISVADAVLPIVEEETARQIAALRDKVKTLADALAAQVSDENAECVACGGSAVGDPTEHFDGCWVAAEISRALVEEPQGGER